MSKLRLFTGDKKLIKQRIEELAEEYNMKVKYSTNIFYDLSKQYGLFFTPSLIYFIFDPKEISDKDSVSKLNELVGKSKVPVVCVIETTLDKRSSFYKTFNKNIEQLGELTIEKDLATKVQDFYNHIETITNIDTKEAVSFLYKLYYDFKHYEYKETAGYCINLVLTGQVKTDLILKVFLAKVLDNQRER